MRQDIYFIHSEDNLLLNIFSHQEMVSKFVQTNNGRSYSQRNVQTTLIEKRKKDLQYASKNTSLAFMTGVGDGTQSNSVTTSQLSKPTHGEQNKKGLHMKTYKNDGGLQHETDYTVVQL